MHPKLFLPFLFLAPLMLSAQLTPTDSTLRQLISSFPDGTQFASAFVAGDSVTYHGLAFIDNETTAIDNRDSVFGIGSITKVFTGILLAHAVEDGKVSLDDYVGDYYDFPFSDTTRITFRQLANHTAGLPALPQNMIVDAMTTPDNPYAKYTPERMEENLRSSLGVGEQGSSTYSNFGFGLLAYTLASKVYGEPLGKLYREKVFTPSGMKYSATSTREIATSPVTPLDPEGNRTSQWDFTDAMGGAGTILSTTSDMVKFITAQFDSTNTTLALTRRPTFETNERMSVGLGWQIIKAKNGTTWYWHNGGVGGYRSFMAIDPVGRRGIVLLTNVSAYHPKSGEIDQVGFSLLK